MSNEFEKNMAEVEDKLRESTEGFEQSVDEHGGWGSVDALGETISGYGDALGEFGEGLGEMMEEKAQEKFGSEEFGAGFFPEAGEAFVTMTGTFAEGMAEPTGSVAEVATKSIGGVIEAAGDLGEHIWDAAAEIGSGDVGGAVDEVIGAVGEVKDLGGTTFDVAGAALGAGAELVEGAADMAWESHEAAVEMEVGLGRDIADGAEAVWDWITDDDE